MRKSKTKEMPFIKKGAKALDEASSPPGQVFLKLQDGESTEFAVIGGLDEIISFDQHAFWLESGNSPIFPCLQTEDCPGCQLNNEPRFKAVMVVLAKTEGGTEERLIIFGKQVVTALRDANDAVGDLNGHILRMSRKGTGLNTRYSLMPTGRTTKVPKIEEVSLNPIENIGPTTREAIVEALEQAGLWNPTATKTEESDWDSSEFVDKDDISF